MDIVVVRQPDGTLKSSPFHVRFGKLKLLKSARKTVTISVNGTESSSVVMQLGHEGEAFFLRKAKQSEAIVSIGHLSSQAEKERDKDLLEHLSESNKNTKNVAKETVATSAYKQTIGEETKMINEDQNNILKQKNEGKALQRTASKSAAGQNNEDYMDAYMAREDYFGDQLKKEASSPKSAHNPMHKDALIGSDDDSSQERKENFGETAEEQRKGLWRSIFGYFRGPKNKDKTQADSKSAKNEASPANSDEMDEQLVFGISAAPKPKEEEKKDSDTDKKDDEEIGSPKARSAHEQKRPPMLNQIQVGDLEEQGGNQYDSEYDSEMAYGPENEMNDQQMQQSSEINMSLCL